MSHVDFAGQTTIYRYEAEQGAHAGRVKGEYRYRAGRIIPQSGELDDYELPPESQFDEATVYTYDTLGRPSVVKDYGRPAPGQYGTVAREAEYAYDPITGAVARTTQRRASDATGTLAVESVVNHRYDPVTGLLTDTWTGDVLDPAQGTTATRYGYDDQGRLKSVTSLRVNGAAPSAAARKAYDALGREDTAATTLPTTLYTYHPSGAPHTVSLPNGVVTTYKYDALNRLDLEEVRQSDGTLLARYDYHVRVDGLRAKVEERRREAGGTTFSDVTITWAYDDAGRLTKESRDGGAPSTTGEPNDGDDYVDSYAYDRNGNRLEKKHVFYAAAGNRTQVTAYAYDDGGNDRLETETTTDSADSSHRTVTSYGYDGNGSTVDRERVSQIIGVNGQVLSSSVTEHTEYRHDLRNRLVRLDAQGDTQYDADGNPLPPPLAGADTAADDSTYEYDPAGNRARKSEPGAAGTTVYVTDASNPTGYAQVVEERAADAAGAAGEVRVGYVVGGDVIAQAKADADPSAADPLTYLLYDGHGSTRALLTVDGNIVTDGPAGPAIHLDYDAFGNGVSGFDLGAAASLLTNLLYSGEQYDSGLRQQYLRARYYDQAIGRFSSFDVYEGSDVEPQSLHKFVYTGHNPVNLIDPLGTQSIADTGATIGGLLALAAVLLPVGVMASYILSDARVQRDIYNSVGDAIDGLWEIGTSVSTQAAVAMMSNTGAVVSAMNAAWAAATKAGRLLGRVSPPKMFPIIKSLTPAIYALDTAALAANPAWYLLTYNGPNSPVTNANRAAVWAAFGGMMATAPPGSQLDEFPYASTAEGGAGAVAAPVPGRQNSIQGGLLSALYRFSVKTRGQKFLVVPVPI